MKMGVNGKPVQHHFWICTAVYLRFLKLKTIGQILQLMRNFMRHQGKRKLSEKFSEKAHYHEQYNKNPKYEEKIQYAFYEGKYLTFSLCTFWFGRSVCRLGLPTPCGRTVPLKTGAKPPRPPRGTGPPRAIPRPPPRASCALEMYTWEESKLNAFGGDRIPFQGDEMV